MTPPREASLAELVPVIAEARWRLVDGRQRLSLDAVVPFRCHALGINDPVIQKRPLEGTLEAEVRCQYDEELAAITAVLSEVNLTLPGGVKQPSHPDPEGEAADRRLRVAGHLWNLHGIPWRFVDDFVLVMFPAPDPLFDLPCVVRTDLKSLFFGTMRCAVHARRQVLDLEEELENAKSSLFWPWRRK